MNPEIKAEWVAALRSGDYPQGTGGLNSNGRFCCLGVLCDIAAKHNVVVAYGDTFVSYGQEGNGRIFLEKFLLPHAVMQWAELPNHNPTAKFHGLDQTLSSLNDNSQPFAVIADVIEASL